MQRDPEAGRERRASGAADQLRAQQIGHRSALDDLASLGYKDSEIPNVYNVEQLTKLRAARDPAAYAKWCEKVTSHIVRTRGALPWEITR